MKIAPYNPSEAEVRREWAGEERRAPVAFVAPALVAKRDHFALVVVAVIAVAALAAVAVVSMF